MDILYILGTGSFWNNNELRYSLRSLEKYAKNVNRIFITGDVKPSFIKDNVIFNQVSDISQPAINSLHKILWTIENTDISENFLFMNDDFFLLKDIDITKYPFYCKGILKNINNNNTEYRQSMVDTYNYLVDKKINTNNYEVHAPIVYNKKDFIALKDFWLDCIKTKYGMLHRSIYCNYYYKPITNRRDCKLYTVCNENDVKRQIKDFNCFSISDKVIKSGVEMYLAHTLPNKCKWER